jgi:hypothetical protein
MKKSLIALAAVAGFSAAAVPSVAHAQISTSFSVAGVSNYVWRGLNLADAVVVQPSLTLGLGESGLALNIWGSAAITDRDVWDFADEVDLTLSYSTALGSSALTLSFVEYLYPNGADGAKHSEEVIGVLGFDHSLAPSILAAYDFGLADAFYLSAGIAPSIAAGEQTIGLGLSAGVSDYSGEFGFNDVTATANMGFAAGSATITPFIGFALVNEDLNEDSEFWAGISVGF